MTDTSARFALPLILPGQAQKEAFHNEALARLDAALHACVEEGPLARSAGRSRGRAKLARRRRRDRRLGRQDGALASWTAGGWRFVSPVPGMLVWNIERRLLAALVRERAGATAACPPRRSSSAASRSSDRACRTCQVLLAERQLTREARAAVDALIATLKSHGLIESMILLFAVQPERVRHRFGGDWIIRGSSSRCAAAFQQQVGG